MGLNDDYLDSLLESMSEEDGADNASLEDARDVEEEEEFDNTGEEEQTTDTGGDDDMEFLELAKLFDDGTDTGAAAGRQRTVAIEEEDPEFSMSEDVEEEPDDDLGLDDLMSEDPFEELGAGQDADPEIPDIAEEVPPPAKPAGISSGSGEEDSGKGGKKKKKKERGKKGPGLLKRIIAFFAGGDEEEEEDLAGGGRGEIGLSRENSEILAELDSEKAQEAKKAKKPKKEKKPKKQKQPKAKAPKKPKKAKPPKPKKEKPPVKPLKPIGMRRILVSVFFGLTVFGMIMMFTVYIPDLMERQESERAFEEGDYRAAYDLLVTKDVKGREEQIYRGSVLCLQMERKLESYENYKKLGGMELEQLHALVSGVARYWNIQAEAEQFGVAGSVKNSYLDILGILQSEYGISEEEALELTTIEDTIVYTKALKSILNPDDVMPEDIPEEDYDRTPSYEGGESDASELSEEVPGLPADGDAGEPAVTGFEPPEETFEMPDNGTETPAGTDSGQPADTAEGDL